MYALVDGNNFYVSCERVFRPSLNGRPVHTANVHRIADMLLSTTSPDLLEGANAAPFQRVKGKARQIVYGYDCYAYAQLASGNVHAVIEAGLKPHDFCALAPVIAGAGGIMTDWEGKPLTLESDGRVVAAANAELHEEILKAMSS